MRACVHACMRACVQACVHACVLVWLVGWLVGWLFVCLFVCLFVRTYVFLTGGGDELIVVRVRGPMPEIAVAFRAFVLAESFLCFSPKENADSRRFLLNLLGMQVCKMTSVMWLQVSIQRVCSSCYVSREQELNPRREIMSLQTCFLISISLVL